VSHLRQHAVDQRQQRDFGAPCADVQKQNSSNPRTAEMLTKTLALLENIPPGTYSDDPTRCFDPEELEKLAGVLNRLLYSPSCLRSFLQARGVSIVPADYYSEIPTIDEIEKSFLAGGLRYCDGLFDAARIEAFLRQLLPYSIEFNPPAEPDPADPSTYSWTSGMYSYSDAMSYYCILRHLKPANVVEIGSGFSSLIARMALRANGTGRLTCIEPYPREFLRDAEDINLIPMPVQDISPEFLGSMLTDGDVLFIDSTHTVKHASDCLHIYLNLLPSLKQETYIHAHDIFLPFTLPREFLRDRHVYWTEQYLLAAYLLENKHASVLYGSAYCFEFMRPLLDEFMHGRFGSGGAGIWFHKNRVT
jgi:predicted O-methyltransferase YrrM